VEPLQTTPDRVRFKPPNGKPNSAELREVHIRRVRELYRYRKLSEWLFDLLYRIVLNFGNWITAVAAGLKSGYASFHRCREGFAEEQKMRPPVFISEEQASSDLEELERKVTVIVR